MYRLALIIVLCLNILFAPTALSATQLSAKDATEIALRLRGKTDAELWKEMQAIAAEKAEAKGWSLLEDAGESALGKRFSKSDGETILKSIEAASAGDWEAAARVAGPDLIGRYLPLAGHYIWALQKTNEILQSTIQDWVNDLYKLPQYRWIEQEVESYYAELSKIDGFRQLADPYLPSYRLAEGSEEQKRMREWEANLFQRWVERTEFNVDELETAYGPRLRQALGRMPTDREIFNHFYYRITRQNLARYQATYRTIRSDQLLARTEAAKKRLLNAFRNELAYIPTESAAAPSSAEPADGSAASCAPSAIQATRTLAPDWSQSTATLRKAADRISASLRAEGIDPTKIPHLPAAGGTFVDRIEDVPAATAVKAVVSRLPGTVALVLPDAARSYIFEGGPTSFQGFLRKAIVPVGKAITHVAPGYFESRFEGMRAGRSYDELPGSSVYVEFSQPIYSFRYESSGFTSILVSQLKLVATACINGFRVFDREFASGDISEALKAVLVFDSSWHVGPHADNTSKALVAIFDQVASELARFSLRAATLERKSEQPANGTTTGKMSLAQRLQELQDAFERGLISKDTFGAQRARILESH